MEGAREQLLPIFEMFDMQFFDNTVDPRLQQFVCLVGGGGQELPQESTAAVAVAQMKKRHHVADAMLSCEEVPCATEFCQQLRLRHPVNDLAEAVRRLDQQLDRVRGCEVLHLAKIELAKTKTDR